MGVIYKPLTPDLRQKVIESINRNIFELRTCEPNALVQAQITSYQTVKMLINGLPDGYPMPMRKEREHGKTNKRRTSVLFPL